MSLSGGPVDGVVPLEVEGGQVGPVTSQHPQHVQSAEASRDVDPTLPVLVGLVHVDVGHVEQLLQAGVIVFFDSTEDGGQYEVVILREEKFIKKSF